MLNFDYEAFKKAVYDIVKQVPPGRATSYGMIAKAIGFPNHSRMVGKIMKDSGWHGVKLPAHRVVNSAGKLSAASHFEKPGDMQQLLEKEGIKIVNNRIINWRNVSWNPIDEISFDK